MVTIKRDHVTIETGSKENNEDEGTRFLKILFDECSQGYIEIRPLPADTRHRIWISKKEINENCFIQDKNVYFGVATREYGKGTKESILNIPAVWVDIDFKQTPMEKAVELLGQFPLEPSIMVSSGGGWHLYWLLKKPATRNMIPLVETINKHLAICLGGDLGSSDAARILRVPGTLNYKYTPPESVKIIECLPDKKYDLADFERHLPTPKDEIPVIPTEPQWQNDLLRGVDEGERNTAAARLAGHYFLQGLPLNDVFSILRLWNFRNRPPMIEAELSTVINSIYKRHQDSDPEDHMVNYDDILNSSIMTLDELMRRDIDEPQYIISPWLCEGSLSMISSPRGVGKTFLCLVIALIATRGGRIGTWKTEKPVGCLYIDGEMHPSRIKERIKLLTSGLPDEKASLFIMSVPLMYYEGKQPFSLAKDEYWDSIIRYLNINKHVRLLIIDNISCLTHGIDENEKRAWDPISKRLLELRSLGVAVILVHHTGKGGDQRGSSAHEDNLDVSISLRKPSDYNPTQGAKFNVEFTKARNILGDSVESFSFQIVADDSLSGELRWETGNCVKPRGNLEMNIVRMLDQGKLNKEIAEQVECTPSNVSQVKKFAVKNGFLDENRHLTKLGREHYGIKEDDTDELD